MGHQDRMMLKMFYRCRLTELGVGDVTEQFQTHQAGVGDCTEQVKAHQDWCG